MKILKIVSSHDGGGVFTCETQYIKYLKSINVTIHLVIVGNGAKKALYSSLVDKSIEIPDLTRGYEGGYLRRIEGVVRSYFFGKKESQQIIRESRLSLYNAVIYRRPNFLFLAGLLGNAYRCKAFWHLPGIVSSSLSRRIYTILCRKFSIVPIANSEFTKDSLGSICKEFVYPGYDNNRVFKTDKNLRNVLNIPHSAPVFGMVARVCYDKAQDLLLEGFFKSRAFSSGAHLLIAGSANDSGFAEKLYSIAGKQKNKTVHFLGEISDLPPFYSTLDIAVNARRNAEAFGISVAEALGAGKPVIAYKLGGPSEMIVHLSNGWLIDQPNLEAYRDAFNDAMDHRTEWQRMGNESKFKSHFFSVEYNVTKLINIISSYSNS